MKKVIVTYPPAHISDDKVTLNLAEWELPILMKLFIKMDWLLGMVSTEQLETGILRVGEGVEFFNDPLSIMLTRHETWSILKVVQAHNSIPIYVNRPTIKEIKHVLSCFICALGKAVGEEA